MDENQGPSDIVPPARRRPSPANGLRWLRKTFLTRDGLLGQYDYAFLFRPSLPFMKRANQNAPFFGVDAPMPVVLALLLGLQHALAMLAGVISPPIILAGSAGANLSAEEQQYLVSTALIVSGILSLIQIKRVPIFKTSYGALEPEIVGPLLTVF
jgi:uric acid-xanthine permease